MIVSLLTKQEALLTFTSPIQMEWFKDVGGEKIIIYEKQSF